MTARSRLGRRTIERRGRGLLSAAVLTLGLGAGDVMAQDDNPDVEAGRVLAEEYCARCHAVGMDSASPHEEAPPFRDVVQQWPPAHLAEALAEGIVVGHPEMPEFTFSESEIDALIAYLESLVGS